MAERVILRRKEREINRIFNYVIKNNNKISFQYFNRILIMNKYLKSDDVKYLFIKINNYDHTILKKTLINHISKCNNINNCSTCRSLFLFIKKKKRKSHLMRKFKLFTKVIGKLALMQRKSSEKLYSFGGKGYFIALNNFYDSLKKQNVFN